MLWSQQHRHAEDMHSLVTYVQRGGHFPSSHVAAKWDKSSCWGLGLERHKHGAHAWRTHTTYREYLMTLRDPAFAWVLCEVQAFVYVGNWRSTGWSLPRIAMRLGWHVSAIVQRDQMSCILLISRRCWKWPK